MEFTCQCYSHCFLRSKITMHPAECIQVQRLMHSWRHFMHKWDQLHTRNKYVHMRNYLCKIYDRLTHTHIRTRKHTNTYILYTYSIFTYIIYIFMHIFFIYTKEMLNSNYNYNWKLQLQSSNTFVYIKIILSMPYFLYWTL